jgi:acetyl-CoA acyltransferase
MSKQLQDAYIVAATRTPIGKAPRGMFKNTRPDDLLVRAIQSAVAQAPGLDPKLIEDAIIGCSFPEGAAGPQHAIVLLAGLPNTIGGVTINRYCASGITAVAMAADRIRVGEADVMIAAGAESMSMVPMMGFHPSMNINAFKDENVGMAYGMGLTAEKVAQQWKVSREAQDAFSLESHQKAIAAQQAGEFADEITRSRSSSAPNLATGEIDIKTRTVARTKAACRFQPGGLAKLKPCSPPRAASPPATARRPPTAPARCSWSRKDPEAIQPDPAGALRLLRVRGVPPEIMGIGPKFAIPAALQGRRHDPGPDRLDRTERSVRRASAGRDPRLGLDPSKVNPMGGAIALGHPLGATGAIRAATTIHALRRKNLKYGMVTMCVGAGMGAAGIFERV